MLRVILLFGSLAVAISNPGIHEWIKFKNLNARNYESLGEEQLRYQLYSENKKMIEEHNKKYDQGLVSFKMKMNEYGDLTDDEFLSLLLDGNMTALSLKHGLLGSSFTPNANFSELPNHVDWREKGALTPVKNQYKCGACWAFTTTGAVEAYTFLKTGKLISLSEQNLLDCTSFNKYMNRGCQGGLMDNAFKYIIENGGIDTEESYPYQQKAMKCRYNSSNKAATVKDFIDIEEGDEKGIAEAVANFGPVTVGIDAKRRTFRFYHKGVYFEDGCANNGVNHAVLVVGYGSEDQEYWIVRNSWGPKWGEDGYFRLARNKDNHCGIATVASFPIV